MSSRMVILDRDGVINVDRGDYVTSESEWEAIPGSLDAIGRLHHGGFRIVVASNQAGLATGRFTVEDLMAIHRKMLAHLSQFGGVIEAIFFCPHARDAGCQCRKPLPGLFLEIARRLRQPLDGVVAIGDKLSDIEAARTAGATPVHVRTGYGARVEQAGEVPQGVPVFDDLRAAATSLLAAP